MLCVTTVLSGTSQVEPDTIWTAAVTLQYDS
jgi:hypothetical protein